MDNTKVIYITGWSGFVGNALVKKLAEFPEYTIKLHNRKDDYMDINLGNIVIHLANDDTNLNTMLESNYNLLERSDCHYASHLIYLSSMHAAKPNPNHPYSIVKKMCEDYIKKIEFEQGGYTIIRAARIYDMSKAHTYQEQFGPSYDAKLGGKGQVLATDVEEHPEEHLNLDKLVEQIVCQVIADPSNCIFRLNDEGLSLGETK